MCIPEQELPSFGGDAPVSRPLTRSRYGAAADAAFLRLAHAIDQYLPHNSREVPAAAAAGVRHRRIVGSILSANSANTRRRYMASCVSSRLPQSGIPFGLACDCPLYGVAAARRAASSASASQAAPAGGVHRGSQHPQAGGLPGRSAIIVPDAVIAGLVLFMYLAVPPVLRDLRAFAQMLSGLPEIQARLQKIPAQ